MDAWHTASEPQLSGSLCPDPSVHPGELLWQYSIRALRLLDMEELLVETSSTTRTRGDHFPNHKGTIPQETGAESTACPDAMDLMVL
eukprot:6481768-Amphidinium_carterae.4